jgi:fibronectin-binding autotransporter adhesin
MKTKKFLLSLLGLSVAAAGYAQTWDGLGADANWTTDDNWGGTAPVANDSLTFDGTTQTTNTNDFAAGTQFNGITLNQNSGPWTLSGNAINLAGNIFVTSNSSSARTHILNMDLALQNAATTITTRGNDNITLNGLISGTTNITKAAAGTLRFTNNANTWTGNMQIDSGGTVQVTSIGNAGDASALGSGSTISFGHANSTAVATLELTDATTAQSTDRQVLIGPDTTSTANHQAQITNNSTGTLTFSHANFNIAQTGATGNALRNLVLSGSNTGANTISGIIQNNTANNRVRVVKNDDGTWVLSGISTYTGGTLINAGVLVATTEGRNFGANDAANAITLNGGTFRFDSNGNSNFIVGQRGIVVGANGGTLDVVNAGDRISINRTALSGSGTLTVTGAGYVPITAADNSGYTGSININGGEVWATTGATSGAAALGSGSNVNLSNNGRLVFSGGSAITFAHDTVLSSGGGSFVLGQTAAATPTVTWNGDISGTGNLTVANSGSTTASLTLGGAVTHTGNTTITSGSTLNLADGASMTFVIGDDGVNNSILGDGTVNLDGAFVFNLTGASTTVGDSWAIVAASLTETYGGTFSVTDGSTTWSNIGDLWTSGIYEFDTTTGTLTVVPEPATYALFGGLLALGAVLIRRRMK